MPELTDDESQEKIVSAVEVREELDEFKDAVYRKLREISTSLQTLQESVRLIETDKEESWEAISHKVSTLVESSVGSLTERLTELEHTVQSQRTTPVTEDDVLNMETWSTLEQVIWSELGKVKQVPNLYQLCEQFHENQKSQEKQLSGLRSFVRKVEQILTQMEGRSRCSKRLATFPPLVSIETLLSTTEEKWDTHAEGVLMVALATLNLPTEHGRVHVS